MRLGSLFLVGIVLGAIAPPINAGSPPIFGETPTAMNQSFGQYWTRLTRGNIVTYTYNPNDIRRLYPATEAGNVRDFEIVFVDNRAKHIDIWMTTELQNSGNGYPTQFNSLFSYLFGYAPDATAPLYGKQIRDGSQDPGGTLHQNHYCVNDGIAIAYEYAGIPEFAHYVSFFLDEACAEP